MGICGTGQGKVAGCFQDGSEDTACVKCGQFVDSPSNYWHLKKGFSFQGKLSIIK